MRSKHLEPEVRAAFDAFPAPVRKRLMQIRALIFSVASDTEGVGMLDEALKWGQPSYLTTSSKSGSTIRIGCEKKTATDFALYFKCTTTLVATFKKRYGRTFRYEGNRAILFDIEDNIPTPELRDCIAMALTYNLKKRRSRGGMETNL